MGISDFRGVPLIGTDVGEHTYYLKNQNERGSYISNLWNVIDWSGVSERYSALKA